MKKLGIIIALVAIVISSGCVNPQPQQNIGEINKERCGNFIIQGARYEDAGELKTLYLQIFNEAETKLTFDIKITYSDNIENRQEIGTVNPLDINTIAVYDVEENIEKISITPKECPGVDFMNRKYIVGLEEQPESSGIKPDELKEIISMD